MFIYRTDTVRRRPSRLTPLASALLATCLFTVGAPALAQVDPNPGQPQNLACPEDPVSLAQTPLTLQDAVERAVCASAAVSASEASLARARAGSELRASALRPQVGLSAAQSSSSGTLADRNTASLGLSFSQLLYDFGRTRADVAAQEATVGARSFELAQQQQRVALDAAERFHAVLAAEFSLQTAQMRLTAAEQALRSAQGFFDQGSGIRLDVLRAQAEAASAQLTLAQSQHRLELARERLMSALQWDRSKPLALAPVTWDAPSEDFEVMLGRALAAMEASPALQAARQRIVAAESAVAAADASGKPSLRLLGSTSREALQGGADRTDSRLALQIDWPVFDGGASRARADEARAALRQEQYTAQDQSRTLQEQVTDAALRTRQGLVSLQSAQSAEQAALAAANQARAQFSAGAGTLSDVLSAQAQHIAARESVVSARLAWASARLQLAQLIGRLQLTSN